MKTKYIALVLALGITGLTQAAVTPEEAKQLGTTLTPWGAIKAGNKEGTIPAYEGGLPTTTAPAGFIKGSGKYLDPFASEKPLYSITTKNMDQYADKLDEVQKEMLKRFPATFRLDVYPTHRVVNYPKYFIDNTIKNVSRCKTVEDGLGLADCIGGVAFPIPKNGNEAMWNVQTAFRVPNTYDQQAIYVDASGTPVLSAIQASLQDYPYYNSKLTTETFYKNGALQLQGYGLATYPPNLAGNVTLIKWSLNPVANPNKGWQYQQGNRRVRVIPDAQYDFPLIPSGGAEFFDETYLFSGKMDRFDFKLLGTREMFIPYNMYRAAYANKDEMTAVGGGRHFNPDKFRWELHRVYVVEATLKPGARHAFAKRRFYIDEDYQSAGMAEAWDHAGKIWRGSFAESFWGYDVQAPFGAAALEVDLATGIWYMSGQVGKNGVKFLDASPPDSVFTPEGVSRLTAR